MKVPIRKFAFSLVLLVVVAVIGVGGWLFYAFMTRPTLERNGGTILVYEIDPKTQTVEYQPKEMEAVLHRRLVSLGHNITVRAISSTRFEVHIPRVEDHENRVQQIKDIFAMAGHLEFRILANEWDDAEAISVAKQLFIEAATDPKLNEELNRLAREGLPPPSPRPARGTVFSTSIGPFTYSWIEVGRSERKSLNLDNAAENDAGRIPLWKYAAEARITGEARDLPDKQLLYSRTCQILEWSEDKRANKAFDYYLLTRDPAIDAGTGELQDITGRHLESVTVGEDSFDRPAVMFRLNDQGGNRIRFLTNSNARTFLNGEEQVRHLAIILDGQIESAPKLISTIHKDGMISGNFSPREVRNLVIILEAGALPARMKALPVTEINVEPGTTIPSLP